jgi:hypothetical protein
MISRRLILLFLVYLNSVKTFSQGSLEIETILPSDDTVELHQPWLFAVQKAKQSYNPLDSGLPTYASVYSRDPLRNYTLVGSRIVLPDSTQIIEHRSLSSNNILSNNGIVDIILTKFSDTQFSLWFDSTGVYRLTCTNSSEKVDYHSQNYLIMDIQSSNYFKFKENSFHYFKIDKYGLIGLQFFEGDRLKSLDIHSFNISDGSCRFEFDTNLRLIAYGELKGEVVIGANFLYHGNGLLKAIMERSVNPEKNQILETTISEFNEYGGKLE